MLLAKKIKLEVTDEDATALEFMQGKCRGLYNWWVMRLRDGERWHFAQAKRSLQQSRKHDPELDAVYGKLLAEVFYRLDNAMQAFFRRLEAGEKPGFPRVRPRHCFFTLCYPAMYRGRTYASLTSGPRSPKTHHLIFGKWLSVAMPVATTMPPSAIGRRNKHHPLEKLSPLIWASKRWRPGATSRVGSIISVGSKARAGITNNWIKSARNETAARRSPSATSTCPRSTSAFRRRSATSNAIACIRHHTS